MKENEYTKNNVNDWTFTYVNYMLFLIGTIFITLGYILMYSGEVNSFQSIKLAPILLVVGYCIIIPIAIIYKKK